MFVTALSGIIRIYSIQLLLLLLIHQWLRVRVVDSPSIHWFVSTRIYHFLRCNRVFLSTVRYVMSTQLLGRHMPLCSHPVACVLLATGACAIEKLTVEHSLCDPPDPVIIPWPYHGHPSKLYRHHDWFEATDLKNGGAFHFDISFITSVKVSYHFWQEQTVSEYPVVFWCDDNARETDRAWQCVDERVSRTRSHIIVSAPSIESAPCRLRSSVVASHANKEAVYIEP